ncbi:hypothetical protein ACFL5O_09085 [Myxococcota bacterium]
MRPGRLMIDASRSLLMVAAASLVACVAGGCSNRETPTGENREPVGIAGGGAGGRTAETSIGPIVLEDASAQGGTGPDGTCGESKVDATLRPSSLLLVIDRSESMDSVPTDHSTVATSRDGGGGAGGAPIARDGAEEAAEAPTRSNETKWELLGTQLLDSLDRVKDRLAFGVQLFPYLDPSTTDSQVTCHMPAEPTMQVPVTDGTRAIQEVRRLLDATEPAGNTPTAVALSHALDYFTEGDGTQLEGDRYVLLATDGGPNCNDETTCSLEDCISNRENLGPPCESSLQKGNCCVGLPKLCLDEQRTLTAIEALADAGIQTFVVGIPGSELYASTLDRFADAGGQALTGQPEGAPRYFRVEAASNMQGLAEVLQQITTVLIKTCQLQLATQPPDSNKLNVYIDGQVIPQQGADGWILSKETRPPTVELQGATCDKMESQGAERVSIQYGCPTVMVR